MRHRLCGFVVVVATGHWSGAARYVFGRWPAASHVVFMAAHAVGDLSITLHYGQTSLLMRKHQEYG